MEYENGQSADCRKALLPPFAGHSFCVQDLPDKTGPVSQVSGDARGSGPPALCEGCLQRKPRMDIYQGLLYPELRAAHDRVYFGAWRGTSPTAADLQAARRQLEAFLDGLEREVQGGGPPGTQEYLAKARDAYRLIDPEAGGGPDSLRAINNALSFGHRVLDRLLRAQGQGNHLSRGFARFYDSPGGGDE